MKPKSHFSKEVHTILAAGLLTASIVVVPSAQASDWTGANATWSSNANPGWNGTGVPNAVGAVANHGVSTTSTTTQDVVAGVTVGTISLTNNSNNSWTFTLTNGITLDQDGAGAGSATISNTNTSATTANFLTFNSGTLTLADNLLISNTGASTRTATTGGSILFSSTSVIAGTGNITIDNVLNDTVAGVGSIRFAGGNNTFAGSVNVRSGGTTIVAATNGGTFNGFGTNVITLGASGAGSASLLATGGVTLANDWVVAAGSSGTLTLGSINTNGQTWSGTGTLNGDVNFYTEAASSNRFNLTGAISGTGNFTKAGVGFAVMDADNTYSGSTKISGGTLRLSRSLALQNSALDTTNSVTGGASVGLSLSGTAATSVTLGGLTGNKNLADVFTTGGNNGSTLAALTLNPGTGVTHTYSGAIANRAAGMTLTKTGNGTQILSGTNTYTGATTVTQGTLVVDGSISTSTTTTVQSGATLGGSGTVGGLTVNSGAFHTPGSSPGIQNTGNYSNAGTLAIEINGVTVGTDYDQVNTTGTVLLTGMLSITMGYTPVDNALFFILANDGTDAISGTFSNASINGNTYTLGGQDFAISYFGNSVNQTFTGGNDVVLRAVVIPEPRAALLGSLGMLMLLRRRR